MKNYQPRIDQVLVFSPEYEKLKNDLYSKKITRLEFNNKVWIDCCDPEGVVEFTTTNLSIEIMEKEDEYFLKSFKGK